MSSESVCQVSRGWVDVGSFRTFSDEVYEFYNVSTEYYGYTLVCMSFSKSARLCSLNMPENRYNYCTVGISTNFELLQYQN
jgi:hypothetical protein